LTQRNVALLVDFIKDERAERSQPFCDTDEWQITQNATAVPNESGTSSCWYDSAAASSALPALFPRKLCPSRDLSPRTTKNDALIMFVAPARPEKSLFCCFVLCFFFTFSLFECARQPIQAFVQTVARGGARALNEPLAANLVQAELVSDFGDRHCIGKILFVGKHEHDHVGQLVLAQHLAQLIARLVNALAIVRVNHIDQALCVLVVVAPKRTNLVLTTDCERGERSTGAQLFFFLLLISSSFSQLTIPNSEIDVFVLDRFDVEADRRNRRHDFAQFQLVQNRRFAYSHIVNKTADPPQ
jgi:hypothetical protein